MGSNHICPKSSQTFCYSCAKQGISSKLVQFHVNLEEAILLCVRQCCLYPLGSGDISRFIIQNRMKQTSSSGVESKFTRPVCTPSNESGSMRDNKLRKSRHHFLTFKSATEVQRKSSANFVKDFSNSISTQLVPEMVNTGVLPHFVGKDKEFVSRTHLRRSKKTVFEPYIPRSKSSCYSSRDITCNKECMKLPVDLEQSYKELTDHEDKFLFDILLNKC